MGKVVIKILQGVVQLHNHLRWANCASFGCRFLIECMCRKVYEGWLAV